MAVLDCVFERVAPKTLFLTAADILCREPNDSDAEKVVLLLLKHHFAVSQVRKSVFSCSFLITARAVL